MGTALSGAAATGFALGSAAGLRSEASLEGAQEGAPVNQDSTIKDWMREKTLGVVQAAISGVGPPLVGRAVVGQVWGGAEVEQVRGGSGVGV